jgi:nucleoside-diphosphate-sugar epimerase
MNGDLNMQKTALVFGAGGFIGSHMVKRLRSEGYWVRGVDLKQPEYAPTQADEFITGDLTSADLVRRCIEFRGYLGNFYNQVPDQYVDTFDEIYQYAADMGGA